MKNLNYEFIAAMVATAIVDIFVIKFLMGVLL